MTEGSIELNIYDRKPVIRDNTNDNLNEPSPSLNLNVNRLPEYPNDLNNTERDVNSAPRPNYGRTTLEESKTTECNMYPVVNQNNLQAMPVPIQQYQQPINNPMQMPMPTPMITLVPVNFNGTIQYVPAIPNGPPLPIQNAQPVSIANGQPMQIYQTPPTPTPNGDVNPKKQNCCNCCDCGEGGSCCCVGLFAGLCAACTCCSMLLCCLAHSQAKD